MNAERARTYLLSLPHVVEWTQWGDLIYSVGDKAIGGKMFCLVNTDRAAELVISFPAGPEHFHDLVEREGLVPAPYFARIHWVSAERWDALLNSEWEEELLAAHARTYEKLPPKVLKILALPKTQQKKLIAEARRRLAENPAKKKKQTSFQA